MLLDALSAFTIHHALAAWLVAANVSAYVAFALDKSAARRGAWRVPESALLKLALVGGSPAALVAQRVLRHKTRKEPFRTRLLAIFVLQAATGAGLVGPTLYDPALLPALASGLVSTLAAALPIP
ncbi:DUF1294 domain-containing protein [Salinarimonas sp.]|uniref:DUF1294 domain-containing protein n=1 Tax=Salinarimonas sp. TaxID=2766526 RepID=UPI00391AE0C3